jgi:hypothetical protein
MNPSLALAEVAQAIKKQPITCLEVPGFVVNRILNAGISEVWRAQEEGDLSIAAIDEGVPAHVLTAALYARFSSRGNALFADKVCSAMRFEFGGHHEKTSGSH